MRSAGTDSHTRANGILTYPHKMTKALCNFAVAVYAAYYERVMQKSGFMPDESLLKEIQADKGSFKKILGVNESGVVKVDLSDLPDNYPKDEMQALYPRLTVTVKPSNPTVSSLGFFAYQPRPKPKQARICFIQINLQPLIRSQLRVEAYRQLKTDLCGTMRHELQHFVQMALNDVLIDKGVIPTARQQKRYGLKVTRRKDIESGVPEEAYLPEVRKTRAALEAKEKSLSIFDTNIESLRYDLYVLEPAEFFPWVSDYRALLARSADKSGRIDPAELDRRISSGTDPKDHFIQRLKVLAPSLFQRAYIELRAFIENHNAKAVEAKRKKSRPKTATSVVSAVIESLDSTDPLIAGYARQHRAKYVAYAQSKMNP